MPVLDFPLLKLSVLGPTDAQAEVQQQHALLPHVLEKKDGLFDYLLGFKCWYHDLRQEEFQALKDISISTMKHAKIHLLWEETKISTMHVDFCSITPFE